MQKCLILTILVSSFFINPAFAHDFNNVKFIRNYDGDTIYFDLGNNLPDLFRYTPIRLYGIDTPEIKAKCEDEHTNALTAKSFVYNELSKAKQINLVECKKDKYFRIDCRVNYDGKDLTKELLQRGYGYEYYGGKKKL